MAPTSIYEPLQDVEYFRLLRVSRHTSGTISGELQNFNLASKSCPHFVSFSYAWGESNVKRSINLHDRDFSILGSVYHLLEVVCDGNGFDANPWLWIDSICINQDDLAERGLQVSLMGKIYRHSDKTVVWLGEGTRQTDMGMDFMHTLVDEKAAIVRNNEKKGGSRTVPANLNDAEKWTALAAVFDRTWWRRVWTLQEFIIAPRLDFYCGTKRISRTRLKNALYSIWNCSPGEGLIRDESWNPAWTRRRLHQWYQHDEYWDKMGLLALMAYSSSCAVTDPRDRIYGLLGLATESDVAMVGKPTYAYDAGAIYIALVKAFIDTYQSLDIICFAQLFTQWSTRAKGGLDLPSWVPDWSLSIDLWVVPLMVSQSGRGHIANFRPILSQKPLVSPPVYAAAGQEPPQVAFSDDFLQITCKGILIDHIDGLGGVQHQDGELVDSSADPNLIQSEAPANLPSPSGQAKAPDDRTTLLTSIVRSLVLSRGDRYLSKPFPLAPFLHDLEYLASASFSSSSSTTHHQNDPPSFASRRFLPWFTLNKSLLIRGHTLESLCQLPLPEPEQEGCPSVTKLRQTFRRGMRVLEAINSKGKGEVVDLGEEGFVQRLHDTKALRRMGRRLCTTREGRVGMAPLRAKRGDVVCLLFGCSVLVVLRGCEKGEGEYEFVGECYLDGFMDGEGVGGGAVVREFVLR